MKNQALAFYASQDHDCSYLPDREAGTLFVDPDAALDGQTYSELMRNGFRRSGDLVYRPRCRQCSACVSVRLPVHAFRPSRSQRRTIARNSDIQTQVCPPVFREEQFELYSRYLAHRHPGGGMDNPDPGKYMDFLTSHWGETRFIEFRANDQLLGIAVVDSLDDGLSAVYTFFDPEERDRALGVYAVLWQIQQAREMGLDYVYLGYWIRDCAKMNYKDNYRPIEALIGGRWRRFDKGDTLPEHGR